MSALLEVRGLSKEFPVGGALRRGRLHAVDDVSFALTPGRVTALAGESGSGKSTIARLLVRLYAPTSGSVLYEGRDVARDRRRRDVLRYRSQVQMIFQDPFGSLNPAKTVRHHLARPLRIHGLRGADVDARVHELLETVGLVPVRHVAEKYPHELSGGQRQRVGIARALAVGPRVVIADEPISMLDVSIRVGILNLIRDLKDEFGIAFLYVTHDLASARYVADDILVMYAGQVVEQGPVDQVLESPLHPYTRLLISSVPDHERGIERIEIRKGSASAAVDPAPGCRFADRCPLVVDLCRRVTPELVEAGPAQSARCHVTAPSSTHREDVHAEPTA
ncbi:MAG TPA: ABC transporter ATP-binding protein [Gaiellaceae bacterium]|nr:ABC transporter ATP-binding protein [Gaiellaceae bacterium]